MHPDFQLPSPGRIDGRSSSITAAFFTAITPVIEPADAEVDQALAILGMAPRQCVCAYCGGAKTEWDHFLPIVKKQRPTGYITELVNLVPSCGKCNQSKGNTYWHEWILGPAKASPKTRNIPNLNERVEQLEAYERWRVPVRLDYALIFGKNDWDIHISNWKVVLSEMAKAQAHANKLRVMAIEYLHKQTGNRGSLLSKRTNPG